MREVQDPMAGVVTTATLADELGVRPETVVRWIHEGKLDGAFRSHGRWLVPADTARGWAADYGQDEEDDYEGEGEEADEDFPDRWDEEGEGGELEGDEFDEDE